MFIINYELCKQYQDISYMRNDLIMLLCKFVIGFTLQTIYQHS